MSNLLNKFQESLNTTIDLKASHESDCQYIDTLIRDLRQQEDALSTMASQNQLGTADKDRFFDLLEQSAQYTNRLRAPSDHIFPSQK